jgi:hypothetical protein
MKVQLVLNKTVTYLPGVASAEKVYIISIRFWNQYLHYIVSALPVATPAFPDITTVA